MAITRVKSPDWGVGEKLTSPQMNALDENVTFALDKRSGESDTLESTVSIEGSGSISTGSAGARIRAHFSGSKIEASASGATIEASANGASILASANGSKIAATTAGAKIRTESGGRLELADNDYPQLATGHTGRTVTRIVRASQAVWGTSDNATDTGLLDASAVWETFDGTTLQARFSGVLFLTVDTLDSLASAGFVLCLDPYLIDGATLTNVAVRLDPAGAHVALPGRMPRFAVCRIAGDATVVTLHSAGNAIADTSASTGVYEAAHLVTSAMDQNNVVDKSQYSYWVGVWNEGGTNAVAQLAVPYVLLTETITDLRPG